MFRTRHGKDVCGSVRCSRKQCVEAYSRTVKALDVESLGQDECAHVDVVIFMSGCNVAAHLARSDVEKLKNPKWRKACKLFTIRKGDGTCVHIVPSSINMIEEMSEDH